MVNNDDWLSEIKYLGLFCANTVPTFHKLHAFLRINKQRLQREAPFFFWNSPHDLQAYGLFELHRRHAQVSGAIT
jgi:hypothetical protein